MTNVIRVRKKIEKVGTETGVDYTNRSLVKEGKRVKRKKYKTYFMKSVKEIQPNSYYLIESLSGARSCYFETEEELSVFKRLWNRYLSEYVETHKMYLSSEGYHILLKVKSKSILNKSYIKKCRIRKVEINSKYLKESWRILSEQMRIFHSVYVKAVNKIRGREGVLVKNKYKRYYFEGIVEVERYQKEMEEGCCRIESQKNEKYRVSKRWVERIRWGLVRGGKWMESVVDIGFTDYVVQKLVKTTFSFHSP